MIEIFARSALVAILAIANFSCTNSGSENAQLSTARAVQYETAGLMKLEPGAIAACDSAVVREGRRLVLHLRSARDKVYEDKASCYQNDPKTVASCQAFILIAHVKTLSTFLILKGYYESADYLLVDDETGNETVIPEFPIFSPSGNRILVLMNGGMDNSGGFEIWRRVGHQFDREWAGDPVEGNSGAHVNYRLDDWKGDTDLELSATVSPTGAQSSARRIHLNMLDGHWNVAISEAP